MSATIGLNKVSKEIFFSLLTCGVQDVVWHIHTRCVCLTCGVLDVIIYLTYEGTRYLLRLAWTNETTKVFSIIGVWFSGTVFMYTDVNLFSLSLSVGKGWVQWVPSTRVLDEHKENSFYNRFQVVVLVVTFSLLKGEQRRGGQVWNYMCLCNIYCGLNLSLLCVVGSTLLLFKKPVTSLGACHVIIKG